MPPRRASTGRHSPGLWRAGGILFVIAATFSGVGCSPQTLQESEVPVLKDTVLTVTGEMTSWGVTKGYLRGGTAVVASSSEPLIRLFGKQAHEAWGVKGDGPGEFRIAQGVAIDDSLVHVLDFRIGTSRLHTFTRDGYLVRSRRIDSFVASEVAIWDFGLLIESTSGFGKERHVVSLQGLHSDTLMYMESPPVLTVSTEGFNASFEAPFATRPLWAASGGHILFWDGVSDSVAFLSSDARQVAVVAAGGDELPITAADRSDWLDDQVAPSEDRMARQLRAGLEEEAIFPSIHPRISEIKGDGTGDFFLRRSPIGKQEIWQRINLEGLHGTFRLPKGRQALAFDAHHVLALSHNEDGGRLLEVLLTHRQ